MASEKPNDGGPAFPRQLPDIKVPIDEAVEVINRYAGMSLRDWFAGQALPWALAQRDVSSPWKQPAAWAAYEIADAMLAARESK